ncbi:MAG: hypothetical protein BRC30_01075, partial [Nanohaloarchaea archaeon SW_7_46_7]
FPPQQKSHVLGSAVLHASLILSNMYLFWEGPLLPVEDALFLGLLFTSTGFWIENRISKSSGVKRPYSD